MFIATSYIRAKKWKQFKCPSIGECINKSGIYIFWNATH